MGKSNYLMTALFFCCALTASPQTLAGEVNALIKDNEGQILGDAVVMVKPLDPKNLDKKKANTQVVDQIDKEFISYVTPVYVNTEVKFPNKDDIRHHVYSFSPAKKFELPLYNGSSASPVLFDKPGAVMLGCNIHDWMIGYIYVSDTPYFAMSGLNDKTLIKGMPAGEYVVRIWHPRMLETEESTSRRIKIDGAGAAQLEWQLPLKPAFKIPRASSRSFGYR